MMHCILHAQRRASCAAATTSSTTALPRQLHRLIRPISTTQYLTALPSPPSSSDEPRTAQKKVMKEKRGSSASVLKAKELKANKNTELMRKAFDAPFREPPKASPEEMERRHNIGRNYVIGCFKRHNEENHDLAVKIRMKKYALRMLPREGHLGDDMVNEKSLYGRWREEAMKINDLWGPPDHRQVAMHTPPIEGFDPSIYMDLEEEDN
ncbi:hypothetical protein ACHAXR_007062 [Thalassiosira sp. AJA248-18]